VCRLLWTTRTFNTQIPAEVCHASQYSRPSRCRRGAEYRVALNSNGPCCLWGKWSFRAPLFQEEGVR
jgi:hypothetical protein